MPLIEIAGDRDSVAKGCGLDDADSPRGHAMTRNSNRHAWRVG
jgi:hypothetical protein